MRTSGEALAQVPYQHCRDLKQTVSSWLGHEGPRLAASLSLYSLLSLAPLVILTIAITSFAFGKSAAQQALVDEVRDLMGGEGARAVQTVIEHGKEPLLAASNALVSFAGIFVLIALILKYVPDVRLRWRDVWPGALATALLFTIGKALLGLYLGKTAVGSAYGAAGSIIVVILWVYYSAMIFYFGAEFTRIRAARRALSLHGSVSR